MAEANEGANAIEERLGSVETQVTGLRSDVEGLRGEVGGLRGEVGGLRGEVQKLRVLGEENDRQIKLVMEVQSAHGVTLETHGKKLDEITKALQPLAEIHDFVKFVASDHEHRIKALEGRVVVSE